MAYSNMDYQIEVNGDKKIIDLLEYLHKEELSFYEPKISENVIVLGDQEGDGLPDAVCRLAKVVAVAKKRGIKGFSIIMSGEQDYGDDIFHEFYVEATDKKFEIKEIELPGEEDEWEAEDIDETEAETLEQYLEEYGIEISDEEVEALDKAVE